MFIKLSFFSPHSKISKHFLFIVQIIDITIDYKLYLLSMILPKIYNLCVTLFIILKVSSILTVDKYVERLILRFKYVKI